MSIIYSPNPVAFKKGQQRFEFEVNENDTLLDVLNRCGIDLTDTRVWVNGTEVIKQCWNSRKLAVNDHINIRGVLHGGGDEGSNPLQVIAMIALIYVTAGAGGGIVGGAVGGGATGAAFSAVVLVAGTYLINSLFAPTVPSLDGNLESASPTYSLQGGSNSARYDQPLPFVVGTHKLVPDLGASPFAEFQGEDQYLFQVFNFGLNTDADITNVKIGDDPFGNYQDVDFEYSVGDTGDLSLFPQNVDTISGGALITPGPADEIIRTSSVDTTGLGVDLTMSLVAYDEFGQREANRLSLRIEYRSLPSGSWTPFKGSEANVEYFNDSIKPLRKTLFRKVPKGQYEVRVRRNTGDETNLDNRTSSANWDSLRSYQPDNADYTGQKRLALKIKATGQLNGIVDRLTATVSNKCLVWNGSTWNLEATSNPAWWYLHLARGVYDANGKLVYGAGRSDNEIDIEGIKAWGEWCDTKSLSVNYVFDRKMVVEDALGLIARTGRAGISFHTGSLGIVYDEGGRPVTQVFGMSNIVEDSFKISYVSEKLADQIIIAFVNEAEDYTPDEVRVNVPGVVTPVNPVRIPLAGVTNLTQAAKEANLTAAEQFYRTRHVTFETDMEGLSCVKGDVIATSHDLTSWAVSGRLDSNGTHSTTQLTLNRELSFDDGAGATYYIRVRHPDGTAEVVTVQYSATPTDVITLTQSLSQDPSAYPDNEAGDAIFQFEPSTSPGKLLKVISVDYFGDDTNYVRLTCTDENPDYYLTESGTFDHTTVNLYNQGAAVVSNLQLHEDLVRTDGPIDVLLTWDLVNAKGAHVRIKHNKNNSTADNDFVDYGNILGRNFSFRVQEPETITVELTAIPIKRWRMSANTLVDTFFIKGIYRGNELVPIMTNVTGLELFGKKNDTNFEGNTAKFTWNDVATLQPEFGNETNELGADEGGSDPFFKDYEIKIYKPDGTLLRTEHQIGNIYEYTHEKNFEDNFSLPIRKFTIKVWVRGKQNQLSERAAELTVNNPAPDAVTGIIINAGFGSVNVEMNEPNDIDYRGILINMSTTQGFTPSGVDIGVGNCVYRGSTNAVFINNLLEGQTYYFRIAAYDAFGTDALNYATEVTQDTAALELTEVTFSFEGLTFTPNDPSVNKVSWTAGTANYNDGTTSTQYSLTAGESAWTSGTNYIYYIAGDTQLRTTTSIAVAMGENQRVLGTYQGGTLFAGANGDAFTDGDKIIAGTIGANQLATGEAVITGTAQIGNAVVKTANIDDAAITSAKIGLLEVKTANIDAAAITNAKIGNAAIDTAQIAAAAITTAKIDDAQITNAKIKAAAVDTLELAGQAVTIPASASFTTSKVLSQAYQTLLTISNIDAGPSGATVDSFYIIFVGEGWDDTGTAASIQVRLKFDGSIIGEAIEVTMANNHQPLVVSAVKNSPSAGNHTVLVEAVGDDHDVKTGTLFVIGTKR